GQGGAVHGFEVRCGSGVCSGSLTKPGALVEHGAMSRSPVPPPRPLAAHVQAAIGRGVQPKAAPPAARPLAPHVQAAIGRGVQPRMTVPSPPGAVHVHAARRAVVQARPTLPKAPHVPRAPSRPGVVQRMEWKRTKGAVETTHKKHSLRWIWAPNLTL